MSMTIHPIMKQLSRNLAVVFCCGFWNSMSHAATSEPAAAPPWQGQYKIKPGEIGRLTESDVVGPDGIVYPNWTRCGVQGHIPQVAAAAKIEDFGARADDDRDDSAALDQACEAVGRKGGGAVLLGEGTYHLDWPVTIRHNGVVIRGRGPDKTRLIFRYALPADGLVFYRLKPGERIGKNTPIILHARPTGLQTMTIQVDDRTIREWKRSTHSGNTFSTETIGAAAVGRLPDGTHTLRATAGYQDGTSLRCELPVVLDSKFRDERPAPNCSAAIVFAGQHDGGKPVKLARDALRGTRTLTLQAAADLAPGDCIHISAPASERWNALVRNACKWGSYRENELRVVKVAGTQITVDQPLRIDFPMVDGSFVRKVLPIERCGVEGFYLEQTENLWISSVVFSRAWNCWARGVTTKMCGRFPVYGSSAKFCEIRDCRFDDAWFKGGGGTAYCGWDGCWDCLMENVETFKLRHGPLFQWAAAGNVIRKSVFHQSDAQWHSGWTHENLIEDCLVESVKDHGSYGFGMWASPPEDTAHGPNGPRNVVYNCDIRSPKTGLWMGGMNENWLILYNRFAVGAGNGVYAKTASFDHIIRGNCFVLQDPKAALANFSTSDCIGIELRDNRLYGGNGQMCYGKATPAVVEGNQALPLGDAPRPQPTVKSIFEWQRR
jgi:hypothetical protein